MRLAPASVALDAVGVVFGLIFGVVGRAAGGLAKAGIALGISAMLLALGGAAEFVLTALSRPPVRGLVS